MRVVHRNRIALGATGSHRERLREESIVAPTSHLHDDTARAKSRSSRSQQSAAQGHHVNLLDVLTDGSGRGTAKSKDGDLTRYMNSAEFKALYHRQRR